MMAFRATRLVRTLVLPLLMLSLAALLACNPATPAEESASADPASAPASNSDATAAPAPTVVPAAAEEEITLHLVVTPLPQDTYYPWLATSGGHLPMRPMWENLTTIDPNTGVTEIYPQLARDWEISSDAREYTFKLQEGIPFHFGHGEFTVQGRDSDHRPASIRSSGGMQSGPHQVYGRGFNDRDDCEWRHGCHR